MILLRESILLLAYLLAVANCHHEFYACIEFEVTYQNGSKYSKKVSEDVMLFDKPNVQQISLNCSSDDPVIWKMNLTSVNKNIIVQHYSQSRKHERTNGAFSVDIWHTVSLTFTEIDEKITGMYICEEIFKQHAVSKRSRIYIYGGSRKMPEGEGHLINRGNKFVLTTSFHKMILNKEMQLRIPCDLNYPTELSAYLVTECFNCRTNQSTSFNSTVVSAMPKELQVVHIDGNAFINFAGSFTDENISSLLQNDFRIQCVTNKTKDDVVVMLFKKPPDIIPTPKELDLGLHVVGVDVIKFTCISRLPIKITTSWDYESSLNYLNQPKLYYKFQAVLKIYIPELPTNITRHSTEARKWHNLHLDVNCTGKNESSNAVRWNYTLNYAYNSFANRPLHGQVEDRTFKREGLIRSMSPESMKVRFVPCSKFAECLMKSKYLYSTTSENFQILNTSLRINDFRFDLPEGIPGMIRGYGSLVDTMVFSYINVFGSGRYILTSTKPQPDDGPSQTFVDVHTNVSEIFEGEYVSINCSVSLLLAVSQPLWMFNFRNDSKSYIPNEYIQRTTYFENEAFVFLITELQLPTLEVTGVSCVCEQIVTATPIVWNEGVVTENSETETELRQKSLPIQVKAKPPVEPEPTKMGSILGTIFGVFAVVSLLTGSVVWRYIRNQRNLIETLREEDVIQFMDGNIDQNSDTQNANTTANSLPYDENYEILTESLIIEYNSQLGAGEFGVVYKGLTQDGNVVAVKCLKTGASASYMRAAMSELKVMLYIQTHYNVVKLIGACTKELLKHKLTVVMEYCEKGDLLSYLRKQSPGFVSTVRDGKALKCEPSNFIQTHESGGPLTTNNLLRWAAQIANGMKYIASLKVIHGDIAARNILLDSQFVVKISDFGLSKKLYEYSKYVRKNQTPLPWRWSAVETLQFTEFSLASDVWAFGITLWEMFSLGKSPYPGQEFNSEFIQMLTAGFRLPLPEHATYEIYNLMLQCWKEIPADRPTFLDIHVILDPKSYEYSTA